MQGLKDFEKQYKMIKKIGEGGYGKVEQALHISTNRLVAIKQIKINEYEEDIPCSALREASILKCLDHTNVVKLLDVHYRCDKQKFYLVFEYIDSDLQSYVKDVFKRTNQQGFGIFQIKTMLYQILKGLEYIHINRVIHRDMKPQNILITKQGIIKIADFGLSKTVIVPVGTLTHEIATLWYRAPEILLGVQKYSMPIDIWGVGLIFAEMYNGRVLFKGDSEIGQIFEIFKVFGTPTQENGIWKESLQLPNYKASFPKFRSIGLKRVIRNIDKDGLDLLQQMLVLNPEKRITVRDALKHQFFRGIDIPSFENQQYQIQKQQQFYNQN